MYFTKKLLQKLLSLENDEAAAAAYQIQHSSRGQGYLNKILRREGRKDFWQTVSTSLNNAKKMIIFADGLKSYYAMLDLELVLWPALIENYDVYIWQGDHVSILDTRPVTSSEEFWKTNVTPATKDAIHQSLSRRLIDRNNYIILDWAEYQKLLIKAFQLTQYQTQTQAPIVNSYHTLPAFVNSYYTVKNKLELLRVTSVLDEKFVNVLRHSVDCDKIEEIIVSNPTSEELQTIRNLFPNLKSISFGGVDAKWLESNFHLLTNLKHLALDDIHNSIPIKFFDLADLGLTDISLSFCKNQQAPGREISLFGQSLQGVKVKSQDCLLKLPKNIQHLEITEDEGRDDLPKQVVKFVDSAPKLISLIKSGIDMEISDLQSVKHLDIGSLLIQRMNLFRYFAFPNLLTLKLSTVFTEENVIFELLGFPKLEELDVYSKTGTVNLVLEKTQSNLQALRLERIGNIHLDLTFLPSLVDFRIWHANSLRTLIIPENNILERIELSDVRNLNGLEITSFTLEHLSIRNSKFIEDKYSLSCPKLKTLIMNVENEVSELDCAELAELEVLNTLGITKTCVLRNLSPSLKNIAVHGPQITTNNLATFKNLKKVRLHSLDASKLQELNDVPLEELYLQTDEEFDNLNPFQDFKNPYVVKIGLHFSNHEKEIIIDLTNFPNLRAIDIYNWDNLKILWPKHIIKSVFLNVGGRTPIDASALTNVEELTISTYLEPTKERLSSCRLTLPDSQHLKRLHINSASITGVVVGLLANLEVLLIQAPKIFFEERSFYMPALKKLSIRGKFVSLDLSHCAELEKLELHNYNNTEAKMLNLRNLKKLKTADIKFTNPIEKIAANNCNNLRYFKLKLDSDSDENATQIDLFQCLNLKVISIEYNSKFVINYAGSPNLRQVSVLSSSQESLQQFAWSELPSTCHLYLKNSRRVPEEKTNTLLSTEQINLNRNNHKSAVSVITLASSKPHIDLDTGRPAVVTKHAVERPILTSFASQQRSKHVTRAYIFNRVEEHKNKIEFVTTFNLEEVNVLRSDKMTLDLIATKKTEVTNDSHSELGIIDEFDLTDNYPLALKNPGFKGQIEVYTEPANIGKVYWSEQHRQHYFRLNGRLPKKTYAKILYKAKIDLTYDANLIVHNSIYLQPNLLSQTFVAKLQAALNIKDSPVLFLFDTAMPVNEKIRRLIYFFKYNFTDQKTQPKHTDFENVCSSILEKKGVCRHRAWGFMILAQLIGVPATYNPNEDHAYSEIGFLRNGVLQFQRVDLGGGELINLAPERKNIFDTIPVKFMPATPAPESSAATTHVTKQTDLVDTYYDQFKNLIATQQFNSSQEIYNYDGKPLLLQLNAQQTVSQVVQAMVQAGNSTNIIFINRPEDFSHYLRPLVLKNGYEQYVEGPLQKLLIHGGMLIINWSNFTERQLMSYKKLLNPTTPSLLGHDVNKNLKIIGVADSRTTFTSEFLTLCKQWILGDSFFVSLVKNNPIESKSEPVDLFASFAWREMLLGEDVSAESNGKTIKEGSLLEAIRSGKPITLLNPPQDEDFNVMLARITAERKLYFNGEIIPVSNDFSIKVENASHPREHKNVEVISEASQISGKNKIYLGMYNFHKCFKDTFFKDGQDFEAKGLLENYNDEEIFYVTESIPAQEWERLIFFVSALKNNKHYSFVLAPGVQIESVAINREVQEFKTVSASDDIPLNHSVISTNDPDDVSQRIKRAIESSLIVDVLPDMGFADLIYEIKTDKDMRFNVIHRGVLKALQEGKTIILNGAISPALYQQLLPLLNGERYLEINGNREGPLGKLYAVIPASSRNTLALQHDLRCDYTWKDYQNRFIAEDKDNEKYLVKLFAFYERAIKLPHRGLGRPAEFAISYVRLRRMLNALKSPHPLHVNNPIKGIFLYAYPKHSEDYAYLNAMAKYFLQANDHVKVSKEKLQKIINRYHIQSRDNYEKHVWKLLNCFSGAYLAQLFPKIDDFITTTGFPSLTPKGIGILYDAVNSVLTNNSLFEAKHDISLQKPLETARELLADPNNTLLSFKGPPGGGKTYAVRKLLKTKVYEGIESIPELLLDKSDARKTLLFDEANLAKPGTFDLIKAILRKDKEFYYDCNFEKLPSNIHIIITGNPENFPERNYHKLFIDNAEEIYFEKPNDDFLEQIILKQRLKHPLNAPQYLQGILKAYHLIEHYNPYFMTSIRDLDNLTARFSLLAGNETDQGFLIEKLFIACVEEFACSLHHVNDRKNFIDNLALLLAIKNNRYANLQATVLNSEFTVTAEKQFMIESLEHDLLMMQNADVNAAHKRAIFIEGAPAIGAATLYRSLIAKLSHQELQARSQGLSEDSVEYQSLANDIQKAWSYQEISADTENISDVLINAFHAGTKIIFKGLNLDKQLEMVLNQLLTGVDMQGKPATKPGFGLLIKQISSFANGQSFTSGATLSPALLNRMHYIYMGNYTNSEFENMLQNKLAQPAEFVKAFAKARKEFPAAVNNLTFFALSAKLAESKVPEENKLEIKAISEDEQCYQNFLADYANEAVSKQHIIEKYSPDKDKISRFILSLPDDEDKFVLCKGIIYQKHEPLYQLFWHKRGFFTSPDITKGNLLLIHTELQKLEIMFNTNTLKP